MSAARRKVAKAKRKAAGPSVDEILRKIENDFHRGMSLIECARCAVDDGEDVGIERVQAAQEALDVAITRLERRAAK